MNKEELLQELSNKISVGEISKQELFERFDFVSKTKVDNQVEMKDPQHFSANKILYVLGAVVVIVGIFVFISQIWSDIGSFGRIFVTLGLGIILTFLGSVLLKKKPTDGIGGVFHTMGGVLIPGGSMVALSEFNIDFVSAWPFAIVFGSIFAFYLLLNYVHKNAILTFFAILNGTTFVYLFAQSILGDSVYGYGDWYAYLTMVIGISYILLGYSFRNSFNEKLIDVLYSLGIVMFLASSFSRVFDSELWQMFYFVILIGCIFLSAYLKSRSILIFSTVFLIAHVSYITGKYFADSVGWPISLVILGFLFIGLGYMSVNISKKYIMN